MPCLRRNPNRTAKDQRHQRPFLPLSLSLFLSHTHTPRVRSLSITVRTSMDPLQGIISGQATVCPSNRSPGHVCGAEKVHLTSSSILSPIADSLSSAPPNSEDLNIITAHSCFFLWREIDEPRSSWDCRWMKCSSALVVLLYSLDFVANH